MKGKNSPYIRSLRLPGGPSRERERARARETPPWPPIGRACGLSLSASHYAVPITSINAQAGLVLEGGGGEVGPVREAGPGRHFGPGDALSLSLASCAPRKAEKEGGGGGVPGSAARFVCSRTEYIPELS